MALDTFNPYLFVSSGEQSNKYLTPTYADGIAKFQAQRAQPLTGLTVRIDPIQEGSGDPSPDNVRPISGRTGLTVTRAGKNLLNPNDVRDTGANIYFGWTTGVYLFTGITYTASYYGANNCTGIYVNKKSDGSRVHVEYNTKKCTFTIPETGYYRINYFNNGGITYNVTDFQLEAGSTTSDYTAYAGQTYPVTWETEAGTVYGGTLDVISGVLTVTHAYWKKNTATMDNIEDYPGWKDSGVRTIVGGNSSITYRTLVGSVGSTIGVNTKNNMDVAFLPKNAYNNRTQTQWKALAIDVEFLLPLATPQTYQLSPTDVKTLAGFNQVYSDAGPVIDINF